MIEAIGNLPKQIGVCVVFAYLIFDQFMNTSFPSVFHYKLFPEIIIYDASLNM
jgi:hypothetical protein